MTSCLKSQKIEHQWAWSQFFVVGIFNTWKMKTDPNIDKIRFHTQYNLLLKTSKTLKKHSNAILLQVSNNESDKALTNLGFLKLSTNISGNYSPRYNPDTESATLSLTTIFSKKTDDIIIKDIKSSQLHQSGLKIVFLCTWTMSVLHTRCFRFC